MDRSAAVATVLEQARSLRLRDETAAALEILDKGSAALAQDPEAALLEAQLQLDAGLGAVAAFERAIKSTPGNTDAMLGLARALVADGMADQACALIAQALARSPFWIDGQVYLAKLRFMLGDKDYAAAIDKALPSAQAPAALWQNRIALAMQEGNHAEALLLVERAVAATGPGRVWEAHRAVCLDELGQLAGAGRIFEALGEPIDAPSAVRLARHLIRAGEFSRLEPMAMPFLARTGGNLLWPYIALAWRLLGDSRIDWLEHQQGLVGVYDLALGSDQLASLAQCLRRIHSLKCNPVDQSLRGGTQTDGYLFARIESEIRELRSRLAEAVAGHIASLPRRDPFHPVLKHRRDGEVAFIGAWSVRLQGGGHHVSHVHPLGWFSSAFYVALPDAEPLNPDAGSFVLGEPEEALALDLEPYRIIRPKPGQLVLFPSTMWHGTRRFERGERLTVAFDVALPS